MDRLCPPGAGVLGCDRGAGVVGRDPAARLPMDRVEHTATVVRVDHEVQPAAHSSVDEVSASEAATAVPVPDWAADAVFYQIFPERFANGDPSNDPTRESLEAPDRAAESGQISPWTGDWYARADWEKELGPNFFENGVFHRRYGGDLQGVIDKLDYLAAAGHQHDLLQPRVLRPLAAQVRRQLVPPHRSPFRSRSEGRLRADGRGDERSGDLALDGGRQAVPGAGAQGARAADSRDHRRRVQSHGPRFLRVRRLARAAGRVAVLAIGTSCKHSTIRRRRSNEFRYKGWWGVDTLPEFADNESGRRPARRAEAVRLRQHAAAGWTPTATATRADGIDGWRLDVANEVPTGFWRDWHDARPRRSIPIATPSPRSGTTPASSSRRAASRPR